VFELVGVAESPADALRELAGEAGRLEVAEGDPLGVDDVAGGLVSVVGHYEDLRHRRLPSSDSERASFARSGLKVIKIK
jgi:hypothetical protein